MRRTLPIVAATAGLVFLVNADRLGATEQTSAPVDQSGDSQQVTVTARRELERRINAFVLHLTDFGDRTTGMARWREPICPLVSGISAEQGNFVLERISEIAQAAGVPLARDKKCRPNLMIMVTAKSRELLQDLVNKHRTLIFGDASAKSVEEFVATPHPVRTWYNTMQKTPDGLPILQTSFPGLTTGQATREVGLGVIEVDPVNPSGGSARSAKANTWSEASHLSLNGVWAIYSVVEVVDATQLKGASLGQLADYVAMSGLAQLNQDPGLGNDPTILTLFDKSPEAASPGMTDWDRAFLKSMYSTEQKSVLQRSEMALEMVRDISP